MIYRGLATFALALTFLNGCTTVPDLVARPGDNKVVPAGPKVVSLIANVKCEFWSAAHDSTVLPIYRDIPGLREKEFAKTATTDRLFTLQNLFQEIDFIAEAQLTLDVTANSAASPSLNFITPYATPATNFTLAVGGQLSDAVHRSITLYTSVDGERLIGSPKDARYGDIDITPVANDNPMADGGSCGGGSELGGNLGLKETVATGLIAQSMNDVAVFQKSQKGPDGKPGEVTVDGVTAPSQFTSYAFGQVGTQVDFTITEGGSAGPNWTLTDFKGPNGSSASLFSLNRVVKDTLIVTILPVCIREKYYPKNWDKTDPSFDPKAAQAVAYPMEYTPEMVRGTPRWANYLPPCNSPQGIAAKLADPEKARLNNLSIQGLGILQQGVQ